MPKEYLYYRKLKPRHFSVIYTDASGAYYYGFFLQYYEQLDSSLDTYKDILRRMGNKPNFEINAVQCPKYLAFFSWKPFMISFKQLLDEIFIQSTPSLKKKVSSSRPIKADKAIKVEKILQTLLFKCFLPKYTNIQLTFTLGQNYYSFKNEPLSSEISVRLALKHFSNFDIVILIVGILMDSMVVLAHSE